jgi:hypothetical protein
MLNIFSWLSELRVCMRILIKALNVEVKAQEKKKLKKLS